MANRLLLCTHGKLGEGLLDAAGMIAGAAGEVKAIPLMPGMSPAEYRSEVLGFIEENSDDEFLCLVDLFGGTPSNTLASLSLRKNIEVVAGINLPALLEVLIRADQMCLTELRDLALSSIGLGAVDVKTRFTRMLEEKRG